MNPPPFTPTPSMTPARRASGKENVGTPMRMALFTPAAPPSTKRRQVLHEVTAESQAIASAHWRAQNQERLEKEEQNRAAKEEGERVAKLKEVLRAVTSAGFSSLWAFQEALHTSTDQQISASLTRSYRHDDRGTTMLNYLAERVEKPLIDAWISDKFVQKLEKEGLSLAKMLVPEEGSNVSSALARYSVPQLLLDTESAAPTLFNALSTLLCYTEGDEDSRKKRDVVLANILSMIAQTQNERASTYQIVSSLYLYACGATKSLYQVLNHAGFSLSYTSATIKLKTAQPQAPRRTEIPGASEAVHDSLG
ncbi:hypothetical protein DFP72DRAFT_1072471 [Ephemerocybe angulata]|uniref:Uncharacterized protein n=1 Tax=Ephemerocybe angulata TaxID=980116 RepID=A0A8H6M3E7_9AGAR|nr:hypothetical protein DFP72DRAFT_1072471 [Tulosesus angulatus]